MVWFLTAIYLSLAFFIDIFADSDHKVAEVILFISFLWTSGTLLINDKVTKSSLGEAAEDFKKVSNISGCKSCKQKN